MAGRPKSKNTTSTKQYTNADKYNESKMLKSSLNKTDKYKFNIFDKVVYHGGMYPELRYLVGVIVKRANNKRRVDYSVQFDDVDNADISRVINCVLESVLTLAEKENVNNTTEESEEITNEN
jgi:lipopolysaccharide export LptBFGC system permease protein LptF